MPHPRRISLAHIALLPLVLLGPLPSAASGGVDQEGARRALEGGEIRSLDQVLAALRAAVPGDVVALKLKREDKRWLYEFKVLTPSGKRREVKVDAKSLAIIDKDDDD